MKHDPDGSPGSHPQADRPNWTPATTPKDYARNCEAGLETYNDRRMAKLYGIPRIELWRWRLMGKIPDELFDRLLAAGCRSTKALAAVAQVLADADAGNVAEVECCPHCGGVIRVRRHVSRRAAEVVLEWLRSGADGTDERSP
jgi:hypothetical protein